MLCTNNPVLLHGKLRAFGEPLAPAQLLQLRCLQPRRGWNWPVVYKQSHARDRYPFLEGELWMAVAALILLDKGTGTARVHHLVTGQRLAASRAGRQL